MYQATYLLAYAQPAYPPEAKAQSIEGKVILDAVIGKDGIIQTLAVREGHPLLAASAMQTVSQWAYRPTMLNGLPVEVATEIEVSFTDLDLMRPRAIEHEVLDLLDEPTTR
jgi:TonB family protein